MGELWKAMNATQFLGVSVSLTRRIETQLDDHHDPPVTPLDDHHTLTAALILEGLRELLSKGRPYGSNSNRANDQ